MCSDALIGLAVIGFNMGGMQGKRDALELLTRAVDLDPCNATALLMLATYGEFGCTQRDDASLVQRLTSIISGFPI